MAISYINTNEVDDAAKEFKGLVQDLDKEIRDLYKRLSEVPTVSKEWIGNQANYYFNRVKQDEKQYIAFIGKLNVLSSKLENDLDKITTVIKSNAEDEARKS